MAAHESVLLDYNLVNLQWKISIRIYRTSAEMLNQGFIRETFSYFTLFSNFDFYLISNLNSLEFWQMFWMEKTNTKKKTILIRVENNFEKIIKHDCFLAIWLKIRVISILINKDYFYRIIFEICYYFDFIFHFFFFL